MDLPQLNSTQGAAPYDPKSVPGLQPKNTVSVYGTPGRHLVAQVDSPGEIIESDGLPNYSFFLNEEGFSEFGVQLNYSAAAEVLLTVKVYDPDNPNYSASGNVSFMPYYIGSGHIHAYSVSQGAPNDGRTPCSVYVKVESGADDPVVITHVNVNVRNGAGAIENTSGAHKCGVVPLNDDGWATIGIVDPISERVRINLSLDQSPDGEFIVLDLRFVEFPSN